MSSIKLSAVIITFNEERNIARCIDSLLPVADEIIVLDSFSTDKTTSILTEKNISFHQREWGGYSDSKNYANTLASGDLIFSIDADEVLSPELQKSILGLKQVPSGNAYEINRLTNYCGHWVKHCGWYPEYRARIFKKGTAEWKGDIHEQLVFTNNTLHIKLSGDLLHYSFPTIESHLKTIASFSSIAADNAAKKGKRANFFIHILLNPVFTFIKKYIFQLGFLDGYYGFIICVNSAYANFVKYSMIREKTKRNN